MPELPEAETIARGLREPLESARVTGVRVLHADLLDMHPEELARDLVGQVVEAVERRGKNVVLRLEEGHRLVVNLGMSGRLLWRPWNDASEPPSHPAVRVELEAPKDPAGRGEMIYHDPRRFGRIQLLSPAGYRRWSGALGPEPLSGAFTAARLAQGLTGSRSPLRSWLLDQRKVAGVGNIYASEACHRARLHPQLPAGEVDAAGVRRLHRAIRAVLADAVAGGGTTLRDYRSAQGWEGEFQHQLRVYGRAGEPCLRCGRAVERIVFSNRSAFFCPHCQPRSGTRGTRLG